MADEWDQYLVQDEDEWAQYEVQPETSAKPNPSFLPNANAVEEKINARPSAIKDLIQDPTTLSRFLKHPLGTTLRTMAGAAEYAEGIPAILGLAAQKANFNSVPDDIKALITGKRPAQLGDLIRTTGFGGRLNEPLAATTGLVAGLGVTPGAKTAAINAETKATKPIAQLVTVVNQNIKNVSNPVAFSQVVRGKLFEAKRAVGQTFEDGLNKLSDANPEKGVDLSDEFSTLRSAMDSPESPGLRTEINAIIRKVKNPEVSELINKLIKNPDDAASLSLKQAQDIKVAVQSAPSISRKLSQGQFAQFTSGDLELLDLLDNIKLRQAEEFPELAKIRKPYAEYMKNYNEVKGYFKPKQLLDKIEKGFGNKEVEKMVQAVIPKDTYGLIKAYRGTKLAGKATAAVGLAILGKMGYDVTRR